MNGWLGPLEVALLEHLERGEATTVELAEATGRRREVAHEGLTRLEARGLVERAGSRPRVGIGRRPIVWRFLAWPAVARDRGEPSRLTDVLQALRERGPQTIGELTATSGWGRSSVLRSLRTLRARRKVRPLCAHTRPDGSWAHVVWLAL